MVTMALIVLLLYSISDKRKKDLEICQLRRLSMSTFETEGFYVIIWFRHITISRQWDELLSRLGSQGGIYATYQIIGQSEKKET